MGWCPKCDNYIVNSQYREACPECTQRTTKVSFNSAITETPIGLEEARALQLETLKDIQRIKEETRNDIQRMKEEVQRIKEEALKDIQRTKATIKRVEEQEKEKGELMLPNPRVVSQDTKREAILTEEKTKKRVQKCCSDWTAKDKIQTSCVTVLIILLLVLVACIAYGLKVILSGKA